jgi:hypothetical protein
LEREFRESCKAVCEEKTKKDSWSKSSERVVRQSVKRRLSRCSWEPAGNEMSAEAEESPLLTSLPGNDW